MTSTTTAHFSRIKSEKDQDTVLYKGYLYRLKRSNKNGNAMIGSYCIADNGAHSPVHDPKLSENVVACIKSIKRRIMTEPTAPIPQIYDQHVKKFRRENGTAAFVPVFCSVKQQFYDARLFVFPSLPKILQSLVILHQVTRTSLGEQFLFCDNPYPTLLLGFCSSSSLEILLLNSERAIEHYHSVIR
ncbi:unnamed protein product [Didymodactylos carnosus]|uniref:Uncharacterized protein n=1 Tax=Didymodactylos carnosus TaxID=1234261 RepID=A0A814HU58_9BILA|nr:unnamed protein product [Didymodactylos carnosus]CAF3786965.1 unnamed protein product [Didymodactylos carnosus]